MSLLDFALGRRQETERVSPQTLLDSLDEAVLAIDEEERILCCNARWQKLAGPDEAKSGPLSERLHPSDLPLWREALSQLRRGKRPAPLWLRLPVGHELHWCELRAQPLYPDKPWPVSLTLCDITPQVRKEQVRDASHRSLNQLVSNLPVMLYRARNNRNWSMEFVSDGCFELTGYSADALVNQPRLSYGALIHPEDAGPVWDQVQEALHRHAPFELHYRILHADGTIRQVSEKGRGLYSSTGFVLGVEGVIFSLQHPVPEDCG
ncbi:MAG: PAS domain-containing protein [Oceanospirillales bacterium]|nr:PAS domain-containing protein [Oceanospirillales bacterium]